MRRLLVLIAIALLGWPVPFAAAQDAPRPRFEVGGQAGGFVVIGADGGFRLMGGPRLSVRVNDQWRVEWLGEIWGPTDSDALSGLYQVLLSRVLRDGGSARSTLLVTLGTGGLFELDRDPERRAPRPDGSIVVHHSHTEAALGRPIFAAAGIGFHRPVSRRATIRSDLQAIFGPYRGFLLRATVGVLVPIGGRYAPTR